MAFPLAAPLIGAGIGALGSIFGGNKDKDYLNKFGREYVQDVIRPYGMGMFQQITGFNPSTGEFGQPEIGPLVEQFGPESIDRFMNPFLSQAEGVLASDRDRALAMNVRRSKELAAATGSQRGSRAGVLEAEGMGRVEDAYLRNLVNLRMGAFGQAGNIALGAQPFRNQYLQEPLMRFNAGMQAANFGLGPGAAYTNPNAAKNDQNIFSGILGGAITGAGFMGSGGLFGGGGGGAGVIPPMVNPPQGIAPMPGPNPLAPAWGAPPPLPSLPPIS